jgi:hypothetical protein
MWTGGGGKTSSLLGPLERANFNHSSITVRVKVRVILCISQPSVSMSGTHLGPMTVVITVRCGALSLMTGWVCSPMYAVQIGCAAAIESYKCRQGTTVYNEWRISECSLVPIYCTVCRVKTKLSSLNSTEVYGESVVSYWSLLTERLLNLITNKEDPDGRTVQTRLAHPIKHAILADSLQFLYLSLLSLSKILVSFQFTLWPSL